MGSMCEIVTNDDYNTINASLFDSHKGKVEPVLKGGNLIITLVELEQLR